MKPGVSYKIQKNTLLGEWESDVPQLIAFLERFTSATIERPWDPPYDTPGVVRVSMAMESELARVAEAVLHCGCHPYVEKELWLRVSGEPESSPVVQICIVYDGDWHVYGRVWGKRQPGSYRDQDDGRTMLVEWVERGTMTFSGEVLQPGNILNLREALSQSNLSLQATARAEIAKVRANIRLDLASLGYKVLL